MQPQSTDPSPIQSAPSANPVPATTPAPVQPLVPAALVPIKQGIFNGRMGRLEYLLGALYMAAAYIILIAVYALGNYAFTQSSTSSTGSPFSTVVNVIVFLLGAVLVITVIPVSIGMQIRRWHDMGHSGWLVLLAFVPFANFVIIVFMFFVPGTAGPNQYGEAYTGSLSPLRVYGL